MHCDMNKPVVLFLMPSLSGGGAERVILNVITHLNPDRCEGKIGVMCNNGEYHAQCPPAFLLSPPFNKFLTKPLTEKRTPIIQGIRYLVGTLRYVHAYLSQLAPDIVVTVTESMNIMSLIYRILPSAKQRKWILRVGNNADKELQDASPNPPLQWIMKWLYSRAYARADHVLAISDGVKSMLVSEFRVPPDHITVIHNPIDLNRIKEKSQAPIPSDIRLPYLISAGRIGDRQKRIDILIQGYAASQAKNLNIPLYIIGKYAPADFPVKLVRDLNLGTHIIFLGFQDNPYSLMANAQAMIHTAEWEGFGCVIAEGLACGSWVIATDCDFGPREIIEHEKNGVLIPVNQAHDVTQQINRVISHPNQRTQFSKAAIERASHFDVSQIVSRYEALFCGMVNP